MVKKIVNNDMSEAKKAAAAVIDFSAVWCGPCKMLAPVLDGLAEKMDGQIAFYNADADENGELVQQFRITNIPALVFLKNGEEVGRSIGFLPEAQLLETIKSNLL